MYTKVGEAVLTPKVSKTLAEFQEHHTETFCGILDKVIGIIIDLKAGDEINSDYLLGTIGDIRWLSYCLKGLVPEIQKGDEL